MRRPESVWDFSAFDWIDPHLQFYKVGSGDLTCYPILERAAEFRKPIILSSGLAVLEDVVGAYRVEEKEFTQADFLCRDREPRVELATL